MKFNDWALPSALNLTCRSCCGEGLAKGSAPPLSCHHPNYTCTYMRRTRMYMFIRPLPCTCRLPLGSRVRRCFFAFLVRQRHRSRKPGSCLVLRAALCRCCAGELQNHITFGVFVFGDFALGGVRTIKATLQQVVPTVQRAFRNIGERGIWPPLGQGRGNADSGYPPSVTKHFNFDDSSGAYCIDAARSVRACARACARAAVCRVSPVPKCLTELACAARFCTGWGLC